MASGCSKEKDISADGQIEPVLSKNEGIWRRFFCLIRENDIPVSGVAPSQEFQDGVSKLQLVCAPTDTTAALAVAIND